LGKVRTEHLSSWPKDSFGVFLTNSLKITEATSSLYAYTMSYAESEKQDCQGT